MPLVPSLFSFKIHHEFSANGFTDVLPSFHVTALIVMNYIWQNFFNTKC